MTCPVCLTHDVFASHRQGFLERGLLTWMAVLPFRCGQCQTRFYRVARGDPRRRRSVDSGLPTEQVRAPRWTTQISAVVTASAPGEASVVLKGAAENASLEGARLRLPVALAEGSQVSVALEGGPAIPCTVRWSQAQGESGFLHGIRFHAGLEQRAPHSRSLRRLRLLRLLRRGMLALIGLIVISAVAYGLVWMLESLRSYDPKFYEPKDIDRERFELQRRLEEVNRSRKP